MLTDYILTIRLYSHIIEQNKWYVLLISLLYCDYSMPRIRSCGSFTDLDLYQGTLAWTDWIYIPQIDCIYKVSSILRFSCSPHRGTSLSRITFSFTSTNTLNKVIPQTTLVLQSFFSSLKGGRAFESYTFIHMLRKKEHLHSFLTKEYQTLDKLQRPAKLSKSSKFSISAAGLIGLLPT
jgi:hypothetical protein